MNTEDKIITMCLALADHLDSKSEYTEAWTAEFIAKEIIKGSHEEYRERHPRHTDLISKLKAS